MLRRPAPCLAVLALAIGPGAAAPVVAGDKPWTSEDVIALKTVSDPQLSPDGKAVAYVVESLNAERDAYQTDVWLVPTAGGEARALASSPVGDDTPRWSPDGRYVAFLSERPRPGVTGDDATEAKRQIWLIRPDGGEAVPLTSRPRLRLGFRVVGRRQDARVPGPRAEERGAQQAREGQGRRLDALGALPVEPAVGDRRRRHGGTPAHQRDAPRERLHAVARRQQGRVLGQPTPLVPDTFRSELYVVEAAGGAPQALVARKGPDASPAWSPDGKWIAFVSQDGRDEEWYTNSYACVVAASGGAPRNLTPGFDEEIGGSLLWTPDSTALVFSALEKTAGHVYR